jgi:CRISPR-associated endonuclease/helicase Cas3
MAWAKTDRSNVSRARGEGGWNPLFAHMLDVAACAAELWDVHLSRPVRDRLAEAFGRGDHGTARQVVAFFAALHDLGKMSDCFLRMFPAVKSGDLRRIGEQWEQAARAAGLPLATRLHLAPDARHEFVTATVLPGLLGCSCPICTAFEGKGQRQDGLHEVAACLGAHHGHIPGEDTIGKARAAAKVKRWTPVRRTLINHLATVLEVDLATLPGLVRPERPCVLPLFSGLVVLADWISSDEERFHYRLHRPPETWWDASQREAREAVAGLRLARWEPEPLLWPQMWPDTPAPRPVQRAALDALPDDGPALVLVESDTGSGKTRLALACAHRLARTNGYQGLYMAMPTRAATDATAREIRAFLGTALGGHRQANLAVVHHTAEQTGLVQHLVDAAQGLTGTADGIETVDAICDDAEGSGGPRAVLDPWYLRRLRGLVAPFGIGTVDQVALAAQPSKHWFLRLFGLANKTVIIDEAHAYELFQRCLLSSTIRWLADAGASVVVLSAALPDGARQALVTAWCEGRRTVAGEIPGGHPVTVVDRHGTVRGTGPSSPERPAAIRLRADPGPRRLAAELLAQAAGGGVVAVVRNRVETARELHRALVAQAAEHGWRDGEIVLIHGMLLPRDRTRVEQQIISGLGPPPGDGSVRSPARPDRLIVVGTQIIEQSLDVSFDRIYSDLAPIDLLLQRLGRVLRHAEPDGHGRCPVRRMTVLWQPGPDGLPLVEPPRQGDRQRPGNKDGFVYAPYTLAATWRLLHETHRGHAEFTTPAATGPLLRAVYGRPDTSVTGPLRELLHRTWARWQAELEDEEATPTRGPSSRIRRARENPSTPTTSTPAARTAGETPPPAGPGRACPASPPSPGWASPPPTCSCSSGRRTGR